MKNIIALILCLTGLYCQAQKPHSLVVLNPNAIVNDSSYLRIYNGAIVSNDYKINDFERVSKITREDADQLGIRTNKPVMLIEFEVNDLESQIDSVLYNRPEFISNYAFPLSIQLPISVNNKLLSHEEKKQLFQRLALKDIKKIDYLDNKQVSKNELNITPFGTINLLL